MMQGTIRYRFIRILLGLAIFPLLAFALYALWLVHDMPSSDKTEHFMLVFSAAFISAAVFGTLTAVQLAHRFTDPIESILETARKVAAGNLTARAHVRTGDEIQLVALALNHLSSRLEDKMKEITEEKNKLTLILEHMDNAVLLFDVHGRVIEGNRNAREWFRIEDAHWNGHNLHVLGNSLIDRSLRKACETASLQYVDLKIKRRFLQASLIPLMPQSGASIQGVLGVFTDVSRIRELQDLQADFIANASHELSTPLTSIRGFAETLADAGSLPTNEVQRFSTIILTESERMQRLIADLLQLAKLDSPEYRGLQKFEPVPVSQLISEILSRLSETFENKNLTVTRQVKADLFVSGNPDWVRQILLNLLENAAKYTPSGGSISVTTFSEQDRVSISVQDTGIGIPAADLPLIFERFYRVDQSRSRAVGGTGLGLSIVKMLVDLMGGKIEVESRLDAGSTFTVRLPALPPRPCEDADRSPDK